MVFLALQLLPPLMMYNSEVETGVEKYFRKISTLGGCVTESGNKEETKWKRISTIFPLGQHSKFCLEVFRLGLVWVQSENFHHAPRGYQDQSRY
jgi:hypothetical protein